jgi:effector-binding domain-containing protein
MSYLVQAADLATRRTAVVRARMHSVAIDRWLPQAYRLVARVLERQDEEPSGPPLARYTSHGELVEVEAGFPVDNPIADDGDVRASGLPGGPAAIATSMVGSESLDSAYHAVEIWLMERGFAAAGPHWEYYHRRPGTEQDPSRWCADIVVPYRWHFVAASI